MYHTIEFRRAVLVDLEISRTQRLERLRLRKGDRVLAEMKPYVIETRGGPVEVADLFFADGTTTRSVPFAAFSFVE